MPGTPEGADPLGRGSPALVEFLFMSETQKQTAGLEENSDVQHSGSVLVRISAVTVTKWSEACANSNCANSNCANSLQSCLTLYSPMDCSQTPLSMGFSRQEYWSGLPCPPPGHLPNSGIKRIKPVSLASLMSPALAGRFFNTSATWEALWQTDDQVPF